MNRYIYEGNTYKQLPVNTAYPMVEPYLHSVHCILKEALERHKRTILFNAILRFPMDAGGIESDGLISRFIESLKAMIAANLNKRRRNGKRVHDTEIRYAWCRENSTSDNDHFHIFILLNGDTYRGWGDYGSPKKGQMKYMVSEAWARVTGVPTSVNNGLVECSRAPMSLNYNTLLDVSFNEYSQSDMSDYEKAFFWMTYIAKLDTKHYGNGYRSFGCSQAKTDMERLYRRHSRNDTVNPPAC